MTFCIFEVLLRSENLYNLELGNTLEWNEEKQVYKANYTKFKSVNKNLPPYSPEFSKKTSQKELEFLALLLVKFDALLQVLLEIFQFQKKSESISAQKDHQLGRKIVNHMRLVIQQNLKIKDPNWWYNSEIDDDDDEKQKETQEESDVLQELQQQFEENEEDKAADQASKRRYKRLRRLTFMEEDDDDDKYSETNLLLDENENEAIMTTEMMDVVKEILDHKWEQTIGDNDKDSKVVLYQVN
ncbi:hypothetical protein QOT17_010988 [Balamuthia mandrillaris]